MPTATVNIPSQLVIQTAAEWAADSDVYGQHNILVTSDVYYSGTDQRKFKLANGVDTWSDLDYMPLGGSASWGGITGTLSDQTDLQTVLNNKEPLKGSDDNYVTDAQLVVISNTSGTNTGDNATNTTSNAYADGKVADSITNGVTTIAPSQNAVFDALALKSPLNAVTDITSSCTIVGWSSFTTSVVTQIDLGNAYLINVYISGTSNIGTASVQLPYTSSINCGNYSYAISNGSGVNGRVIIAAGSDTIDWRAAASGTSFAATGTKLISGQFWFPKP
jgi:hypothetical protein